MRVDVGRTLISRGLKYISLLKKRRHWTQLSTRAAWSGLSGHSWNRWDASIMAPSYVRSATPAHASAAYMGTRREWGKSKTVARTGRI